MENANRALAMAGSTLIAVIVFALVVYFFQNISTVPELEDDKLTTEQLSKFNLEYEVYEKSAMYGVDVISCLNKAKSNNEKYVEGGSFLSGQKYGEEYFIDIKITIKSKLIETIEVKGLNNLGKELTYHDSTVIKTSAGANVTLQSAGFKVFGLTSFSNTTPLQTKNDNSKSLVINRQYSLEEEMISGSGKLLDILEHSKTLKQIVRNKDSNILIATNGWNTAIWSTYLYDFKIKRFTCTGILYSPVTGRVCEMTFEELN